MVAVPFAGLGRFWRAGVDRCRDAVPGEGTDRRVSVFGYLFLGLNLLFFAGLTVAAPDNFEVLNRKDSWVEVFTALGFFLGGLLLWGTALLERRWWRRVVYGLAGAALVFTAGEEISWGQTFFIWLESPDFMVRLAKQNDLMAHNNIPINFFFFSRYGLLLLGVLTGVFFFCRKERIAGIPLPSVMLTLGMLAALAFASAIFSSGNSSWSWGWLAGWVFGKERELLLILLLYCGVAGRGRLFLAAAAVAVLAAAFWTLAASLANVRGGGELVEYCFGLISMFYAGELLLAQGSAGRRLTTPVVQLGQRLMRRGGGHGEEREPGGVADKDGGQAGNEPARAPWLTAGLLVLVGGVGLAVYGYFDGRAERAELAAVYADIRAGRAGEPVVRGDYEVYRWGDRLAYFKESCTAADTGMRFFLHVVPEKWDDLPEHRRRYWFDNWDFTWDGAYLGEDCLTLAALPDYDIRSIRTGQGGLHPWAGVSGADWNDDLLRSAYPAVVAGEPAVRSGFDVYLSGKKLSYVREECAAADTALPFFLHVLPQDWDHIPDERREFWFDNRDFEFEQQGIRFEGKCIAMVTLPDYPVDRVLTGQYAGEGPVWETEIAVGR